MRKMLEPYQRISHYILSVSKSEKISKEWEQLLQKGASEV
jgi:hypothetical protein